MAHKSQKRRYVRLLSCEEFESRLCLSSVSFASHDVVVTETDEASSVFTADLDGDGDVDVLSASRHDDKIAWYENTDGKGTFGEQQIITTAADHANSVYAADVDGDGDVDVLSASHSDHKIAWYENTDGKGTFGEQQIITAAANHANSVYAADVDGDGDLDVLSASSSSSSWGAPGATIAWYENTDGKGSFGEQKAISTAVGGARSVYAADLDGDGDMDVLSASYRDNTSDNKIAWHENTDGKGTFGEQKVITKNTDGKGTFGEQQYSVDNANSVYAADVDGDGDLDVLSASSFSHIFSGSMIAWYENTDGKGTFGEQQVITTAAYGANSVYAADVDGDGDLDVLSASSFRFLGGGPGGMIAWYENTDGKGSFGEQKAISTAAVGASSVYAADVDGDGDVDVLSASFWDNKIAWYENSDGKGTFGEQKFISTAAVGASSVYAADVDGDGDVDVLSASYRDNKIAWYDNGDGKGTFGRQKVISTAAVGASSVYAADVDGDGDIDVLSASSNWGDNKIAWYENSDGKGSFGQQKVITTAAYGANSVYAADVDGDGDVDVLSASSGDGKIAWYENADGEGTFGEQQVITTAARAASSVYAVDVDGDGDVDVLSASRFDGIIAWYENTNGKGSFGPQKVIATAVGPAESVYAADLDGDGDVDVLAASREFEREDRLAWYENTDGKGSFGKQKVITTEVDSPESVYAADVDGDGDMDVLSASSAGFRGRRDGKIAWYENSDGKGTFGPQQVITTSVRAARSVYAADVDGDGDVDVLSASFWDNKIAWYENRPIGDSNDDGVFDSLDLVKVLQANRYKDDISANATFDEGDWNGDGVFDQQDIVAALQTGNYLQGLDAAVDAVSAGT